MVDWHQVPIAEQVVKVQVMLATPWASVVFSLALAVTPGRDNVVVIDNKPLRERLGINVLVGLKSAALRGLGQNAEVWAEEVTVMTRMAKEDLEARELRARQVIVSMESSSASQEVAARLRAKGDDIHDTLKERSAVMFMDGRKAQILRTEALKTAFEAAQRAGMANEALDMLAELVVHTMKDVFKQTLTAEPPALVEPLCVMLEGGAGSRRVRAKLQPMLADRKECLENQMGKLKASGMVFANLQVVYASDAIVVTKFLDGHLQGTPPTKRVVSRRTLTEGDLTDERLEVLEVMLDLLHGAARRAHVKPEFQVC